MNLKADCCRSSAVCLCPKHGCGHRPLSSNCSAKPREEASAHCCLRPWVAAPLAHLASNNRKKARPLVKVCTPIKRNVCVHTAVSVSLRLQEDRHHYHAPSCPGVSLDLH